MDRHDLNWLLHRLWQGKDKERVCLNIPDTLVASESSWHWLFTSNKTGMLLRKSDKTVGEDAFQKAVHHFLQVGNQKPQCDPVMDVVAHVIHKNSKKRRPLTIAQLELGDLDRENISVLQQAVPGKNNVDIECKYKLDQNGFTFSTKIKSKNKIKVSGVTRDIDDIAARIARHIQLECDGMKVDRMKLHLVLGAHDKLWVVNVNNISLTEPKKIQSQEVPIDVSTSKQQTQASKVRRCAGDFCGYNRDHQVEWLHDTGTATVSVATNIKVPEEHLKKIQYRSIVLAQEKFAFELMDPILEMWTKQRDAGRAKMKTVVINEPSNSQRDIGVVMQDSSLVISWEWTGPIEAVNISLVPYDEDTEDEVVLATNYRNSGRIKVEIPYVHPNWYKDFRFFNIQITDASPYMDDEVVGFSDPFLLGGAREGDIPQYPKRGLQMPRSRATKNANTHQPSFSEAHNLANYHRTAKVCPTCAMVYNTLDAARLERNPTNIRVNDEQQQHQELEMSPLQDLRRFAVNIDHLLLDKKKQRKQITKSTPSLFERLSEPKKSLGHDFVDNIRWGAGYDLRRKTNKKNKQQQRVAKKKESTSEDQRQEKHFHPNIIQQAENLAKEIGKNIKKQKKKKATKTPLPIMLNQQAPPPKLSELMPRDKEDEQALDWGLVEPESHLFQVLCLLALGQLEDCKMMIKIVDKRGLASLAFCKVEDGRIVVQNEKQNDAKEMFVQKLQRTRRGRQTLVLLSQHLSIATMFVYAMETQAKHMEATTREALLKKRSNGAVQALESFSQVHKIAAGRLHIMKGVDAILCEEDKEKAFDQWRLAVAAAARLEGMWSYNVGVAHYLLGKHTPKHQSARESHLAAAAAIFSRLDEIRELEFVQMNQQQNAKAKRMERQREDQCLKEKAAVQESIEHATDMVSATRQRLHNERLLPVYMQTAEQDLLACSQEVQRVLEAAEADIEILKDTSPEHKHFHHRKDRIKDALELLQLKTNALAMLVQQRAQSSESGYRPSEQDELDSIVDDEHESEHENDSTTTENENDSTTERLFKICRDKNLMQLQKSLKEWCDFNIKQPSSAVDDNGNTLLHVSAMENWIQGIHTCLSNGININAKNLQGDTPLHLARRSNNSTAETLLIALGSDTTITNLFGKTYEE